MLVLLITALNETLELLLQLPQATVTLPTLYSAVELCGLLLG
jgi:hypothetical protein